MCIETKYVYLKSNSLFKELDETKLMELSTVVKVHNLYRSESINYGDGDYSKIYFVVKGKVKIAESNDMGDELIKDILTEGDFFGDLSLCGNQSVDEYAEALTANTIVCSFKVSDFRRMLQSNPYIALSYADKVNSKLRKLENRHSVPNYLTHSDIAGFISTSRQSVNVLLNELRDSGMLFYNRKKIELNDPGMWN